jgi:hypothetical protein
MNVRHAEKTTRNDEDDDEGDDEKDEEHKSYDSNGWQKLVEKLTISNLGISDYLPISLFLSLTLAYCSGVFRAKRLTPAASVN